MRFAWGVAAMVTLLVPSGVPAAEAPKALSDGQFEYALGNISTAPNYILVTVVSGNTGRREPVCMEAQALLTALLLEHGLNGKEAVAFALAQPDRTYRFSNANALKHVARAYSDEILREARDFLGKMTVNEIEIATRDQKSKFYDFCARTPGGFGSRFPAVAHALAERGILCVRGCKPGLFYIDRRTGVAQP